MRSQGQVRFIKVSTRVQALAAAAVLIVLAAWLATMVSLTTAQWAAARERNELRAREARVASAQSRVEAYRKDLRTVASDLARRQDFIQRMVEAHLGDLPDDSEAPTDAPSTTPAADAAMTKISQAVPEAGALARVEADQLAFVERLTLYADRRSARAAEAIRSLGLNPRQMAAAARPMAEGGPLLRLATSSDGSLDPQPFRRAERLTSGHQHRPCRARAPGRDGR